MRKTRKLTHTPPPKKNNFFPHLQYVLVYWYAVVFSCWGGGVCSRRISLKRRRERVGVVHHLVPSQVMCYFYISSWLAEQEVRGSIPGLAAMISEIGYETPASKSWYGWKIAKAMYCEILYFRGLQFSWFSKQLQVRGFVISFVIMKMLYERHRNVIWLCLCLMTFLYSIHSHQTSKVLNF